MGEHKLAFKLMHVSGSLKRAAFLVITFLIIKALKKDLKKKC